MKRIHVVLIFIVLGLLVSSCGALPTLPPLDATVTIKTPNVNVDPGLPTATGQVVHQEVTEILLESPSAPPETAIAVIQPIETGIPPTQTDPITSPAATDTNSATNPPEPTSTATRVPYTLQVMNPHYLGNFTHSELGCDWLGIGGQIFNSEGVVQKDIIIKTGGDLDGSPAIEQMTMPLADPDIDLAYGPGGFELTLANSPAESDSTLWIQLFSLEGDPLSEQIFLITYDDCQKNLLLINFIEE